MQEKSKKFKYVDIFEKGYLIFEPSKSFLIYFKGVIRNIMNTFNQYNNANVVINNEFIFDPWLYGSLYNNSWYPYGKKTLKENKLKKIKYCFISHLHQDHWDLDTIKYLPKKTLFIIPKFKVNKIIENTLKKYNFKNILYAPIKKFINIDNKYYISVVRPLNNEGLETKSLIYKNDDKEIDAGCIVRIKKDMSNHLLLSDNTPYNVKGFLNDYKKIEFNTVWSPFNGYASDYPFCYDNFSIEQKKKISKKHDKKKQKLLFRFFKKIKPNLIIPYSSQFTLKNKNEKIFNKIVDRNFLSQKKYCDFFVKKFKTKNITYLKPNQTLHVKKNQYIIKTDNSKNIRNLKINILKSNFPQLNSNYNVDNFVSDLNATVNSTKVRIKKYKLNVEKINQTAFFILINNINKIYRIDFKKSTFYEYKNQKNMIKKEFKKSLVLKVDLKIISNILNRKLHINNCQIGLQLNWERYPNHYNQELYDALNFFHK